MMRTRWQATLTTIKMERWHRMHEPLPELGAYVRAVVTGHVRYYGVPMNSPANTVKRLWWRTLQRRGPRSVPWQRMHRYIARCVPPVRHLSSISACAIWPGHPRLEPDA